MKVSAFEAFPLLIGSSAKKKKKLFWENSTNTSADLHIIFFISNLHVHLIL